VLPVLVSVLSLFVAVSNSPDITGSVVDASGRPVPRAHVTVVDAGVVYADTLTAVDGTFHVASAPAQCQVEASLPGFTSATAACDTSAPLRLTLQLAPIADNIVVSATRTEAPAGQVAAAITVFDAADIARRQQPLLADLLRDAPGTMVVTTGSPGSVTSMFVRGGESNYTKVLLDGIPLNEPGGAFNLSNVTTDNLDRVEMVRGANSALYGSDAMTGVVQLFTRRGSTAKPDVQIGAEGGTFSTGRVSATVSGGTPRADYSVAVAGLTTDNEVPNSAFDNLTVSASGGATLAPGTTLRSVFRLERGTTGTPGQTAFGRPDLDALFERHDGQWGVSFDQTRGALHQSANYGLAVSHQASTDLIVDPDYTPSYQGHTAPFPFSDFTYDSRTDLTRHRASYQIDGTIATARAGTHVETALVDWDGERATLADAMAGTSQAVSRNNVGLSFQHQALWSRVFVTAGVRFEHNASFGDATVPRIAAAWYAHAGNGAVGVTRIHGTAGTGIKEPTVLQSFSPNPYFMGNPNLEPERARTVDFGVEQRFAGDRVRVDATWFDNRYRDIISLGDPDPVTFASQYFNIGLTRARGAELSGDVVLARGLRAGAAYTLTDSEILESTSSSPAFAEGRSAFRRPRHAGSVELAWTGGRAAASLNGVFVGQRSDSDLSALEPPLLFNEGYATWGARASFAVTRNVSLTGAIDNLTDSHYMEPLGYPVLPRAFRGGLRLHF
jgi:outer membrane cobalamin receptor